MTKPAPPMHPADETAIAACEAAVGFRLPGWLRERLARENGWTVDDALGPTRVDEWRFLPVLDRGDRKRMTRTAEDIAWHTRRLRAEAAAPEGAVAVARGWDETMRLILLPDPADPTRLGDTLWRQHGVAAPQMDLPIDPEALGRKPKPAPGSRARPRKDLPVFRYHPDPVATGSIVRSLAAICPCCGKRTGWEYPGIPYGLGDQPAHLCPWCIADGSAHARFGSSFVSDIAGSIPQEVADEVDQRTPGYPSWQGERWQTCCGDAAEFLGPVGWERLKDLPDAQAAIVDDGWSEDALPLMRADGDLTGYLFRCRHCGRHLAHADAS